MTLDPREFPRHILLVEDNDDDVMLAQRALAERGATQVTAVTRAAQALDYLYRRGEYADRAEDDPALVVLDLSLPDGSGLDVLRQLQNDPRMRHIPVVVLTVSEKDADRSESYAAGASVFLQKPVQYQDFVATMRAIGRFWRDLQFGEEEGS
ncbi:response regulator [Deinococcus yavapaiensis]|uniref:Response regulator receiver domain-containing protein n=1 Tax=Deinococcus yavapaiensis KR-236 TaxID=694435 RepID=A0A318S9P9_9DEIO|nr:response regulator [Deinococcus yavapaiensis]PYE53802.1 response regulator receiver domain-containing protein [Deinococcus yavapaiensis KR-236]